MLGGLGSKAKLCGLALALLISAGAAQADDATEALRLQKWQPWFEMGGYGSNEDSRGESVLFAPLWQSATALLFTDLRGKLFDRDDFEGNFALGLRAMQPSGWNLGAWIGWDVRRTQFDNTFNQVSFGVEAISTDFDLRLNGYLPANDDEFAARSDTFAALLAGNSIFVKQTTDIVREYALYGIDGEIGFRLPLDGWSADAGDGTGVGVPRHELRLYGGGYWFDQDGFNEEVAGPRARLEWRINDVIQPILGSRLTIEAEYQYDDVRDHQYEIGARLRIPFGGGGRDARNAILASLTGQERRMIDGLERDPDIVVQRQTDTTETLEAAIDNETNIRFDRVAYVGDGDDLQATVDGTGQNSLILLTGGTHLGNFVTLANQTLQGGASTIFIRGARSGAVVPFTAPGTKPTLQGGRGLDVLFIGGDNVHIAGLGIDGLGGTSDDGIDGDSDRTNIVLQQNMITNTGNDGIEFDFDNTNIRVFNNMITNPGDDGIDFEGFNSNIRVFNNTITNPGDDGIDFEVFNSNITITGNTINIASGGFETDGLDFAFGNTDIFIANNIITVGDNNEGGDGIEFFEGNSGITIVNNEITIGSDSDDGDGIFFRGNFFGGGNRDIFIANNIITLGSDNVESDGIFFLESNSNIDIANNIITLGSDNVESDGIFFLEFNSNIDIANNIVTVGDGSEFSDGIFFGGLNTNTNVVNNLITLGSGISDSRGMFFASSNANMSIANNNITVGSGSDNGDGMFFGGSNTNMNIANNLITVGSDSDNGDGMFFGRSNTDIIVANNVIRTGDNDPDADGIELEDNNGVLITGNTITPGSLGDGINIGNTATGVGFNDVVINDNLFNGPGFDAVFNFVAGDNTADGSGNSVAPGITPNLCVEAVPNAFNGSLEINGSPPFIDGC